MIKGVCCVVVCAVFLLASSSYAGNIYSVTGVIQKIESHVITMNGRPYYPVAEDSALEEFEAGDSVTMRYGQNKKGTRYYSQIIRAGENLPEEEELPPA